MSKYIKNLLTICSLIIIGAFLVFLYNCITGLSGFAARFDPALEQWVFWGLSGTVGLFLLWGAVRTLWRPRPLLIHAEPTEAELHSFRSRLVRRLRANKHLREAGVQVTDEADLEAALTVLESKADEEIRSTAKQVFIGSAVAQNGRLDTLVVLYLVSRLTYRISKLYNQRPHHRELVNLYANIAVTSFIAGSIEDLGIDEYVTELMTPLMSGSAIGAVPGAQAIAGTITQSVMTGSTNCLLALRCGIVARNYMSLRLDSGGTMRRAATIEASKMFVNISGETVTLVTKMLVKGASNAVKNGAVKVSKGVGSAVSGAAQSVGTGAKNAASSVTGTFSDAAHTVGKGAKNSAKAVSDSVKSSSNSIKQMRNKSAQRVSQVTDKTRKAAQQTATNAADKTKQAIRKTKHSVQQFGSQTEQTIKQAGLKLKKKAKNSSKRIANLLGKSGRPKK